MTKVTKTVVINATREAIRPYFDESERLMGWSKNVYRWEPDAAWPNPGSQSQIGFKTTGVDVDGVATAMEYDLDTMHSVYKVESGEFEPSTWEYTFDEKGGRTIVTARVEYTVPGRLLGPALDKLVVERGNSKLLEETLKNLKAQVEASA